MARSRDDETSRLLVLGVVAFVVAVLYFAQEFLLPLALAILLSFVLAPLVTRLERWRIPRIPAVILSALLAFGFMGGMAWVVVSQLYDLSRKLPQYQSTLIEKIETVQELFGGPSPFARTIEAVQEQLTEPDGDAAASAEDLANPVPVRVVENLPLPVQLVRDWLGPMLAPLGTAAIVVVFVIFMLLQREELRDRLIRLGGTGRLYLTTQALDEAGARVSRYLVMQLIINATYGLVVAVGLYFIGLPNALLWGLLAAVVRFVPYVGPWLGALLPIALSTIVFPGWTRPLLTIGLFVGLELFSNNVMEPWLYGTSTGVSAVGIITAAVFWTWLWGPVGLVLSTPLTVCLTVLGRHVPSLNFLNVLLSDQPALELNARFYQRLLAFDEHEANDIAGDFLKTGSLDEMYEQLVIPALSFSERDRSAGHLSDHQLRFIHRFIRDLTDGLGDEFRMAAAEQAVPPGPAEEAAEAQAQGPVRRSLRVLCVPAEDRADRLPGRMLVQLLRARGHFAETAASNAGSDKLAAAVDRHRAQIAIISALAPGGAIQARDGCRRLRPGFPDLRIAVGLWNARGTLERTSERLRAAGAAFITTSISEALKWVDELSAETSELPERVEAVGNEQGEAARTG